MATQTDIDELRDRLGNPGTSAVPDAQLYRALAVAESLLAPHVPAARRADPAWAEAVQALGVRLYEERGRGRAGADPTGEFDSAWTPGVTSGLVKSVWGLIEHLVPLVLG